MECLVCQVPCSPLIRTSVRTTEKFKCRPAERLHFNPLKASLLPRHTLSFLLGCGRGGAGWPRASLLCTPAPCTAAAPGFLGRCSSAKLYFKLYCMLLSDRANEVVAHQPKVGPACLGRCPVKVDGQGTCCSTGTVLPQQEGVIPAAPLEMVPALLCQMSGCLESAGRGSLPWAPPV